MSTITLFDPPSTSTRKKGPSSLRSLNLKASRSDLKTSNSSKDSLFGDLLGIKSKNRPAEITDLEDSPTLNFSSSASIASGSTDSSTSSSSVSSTASTATKASISLTDHDLFGIKLRQTREPQVPQILNGVDLGGETYKVPEPVPKQFYRDLTFMEDEELVQKYGLVKIDPPGDVAEEEKAEEDENHNEKSLMDWLKHPPAPKMSITKFV
ncbi:hypothetical protein M409DRAFT_23863 [Zasmidium cellare ATCC 36951]|uniref:Uncharacterized protein n=1 Tax=Zasmidium cellare ATCC 36951 TaxID=1080233 RepID=A0A6A6CEB8_ZASCE|nr:uncharacterized protein M409DRAFT_23863 [Zasmidium cellare ATCC 36951]KAF2165567.1 hypothetical protein M409DRAFT_23863 [Zasmidium cellare ATCC 36951]